MGAFSKSQSSRDTRSGRHSTLEQHQEAVASTTFVTNGSSRGEHIASQAECVYELEEEDVPSDTVTPPQKQRRGRHYVSSPCGMGRSLSHDPHLVVSQSDNSIPMKPEARLRGAKATTAKGTQSQQHAPKSRVWRITKGGG